MLFDEDAALTQRLHAQAVHDLGQALPDPRYSGWRVFFALILGLFTLSIVTGILAVIRDGTTWGSFIVTSVVILLLDWAWIASHTKWRRRVTSRADLRGHLAEVAAGSAMEVIRARRIRTKTTSHEGDVAPKFDAQWPPPFPQPYGVNDAGAEALVGDWMRHLGALDTVVTRVSNDGGIDAYSSRYIAQTKNYTGTVGVAEVRELAGVCAADGRRGLFFTSGVYAVGAIEFADRVGIALFIYDAVRGTLVAANPNAQTILNSGL